MMSAYVFLDASPPPPPAIAADDLGRITVLCLCCCVSFPLRRHTILRQTAIAAPKSAGAAHAAAISARKSTMGTTIPATTPEDGALVASVNCAAVGEGEVEPVCGGVAVREGEGVLLEVSVEDGDKVGVREGVGAAVPDNEARAAGLAETESEGVAVGELVTVTERVCVAEAAGAGALTLKPSMAPISFWFQGGALTDPHTILSRLPGARARLYVPPSCVASAGRISLGSPQIQASFTESVLESSTQYCVSWVTKQPPPLPLASVIWAVRNFAWVVYETTARLLPPVQWGLQAVTSVGQLGYPPGGAPPGGGCTQGWEFFCGPGGTTNSSTMSVKMKIDSELS
jgi:hypothetical protein